MVLCSEVKQPQALLFQHLFLYLYLYELFKPEQVLHLSSTAVDCGREVYMWERI